MDLSVIEKTLRPAYYKKKANKKILNVGLPSQAYFYFLQHVDDDYLSEWEVMKYRECFKSSWNKGFYIPFGTFALAYALSPILSGIFMQRIYIFRIYRLVQSCCLGFMTYFYLNTGLVHSKPFFDIITQPEPNGQYTRTILKEQFPRHWAEISKNLHEMGYNFKEMNEYSDKQDMPDVTNKFDNSWY